MKTQIGLLIQPGTVSRDNHGDFLASLKQVGVVTEEYSPAQAGPRVEDGWGWQVGENIDITGITGSIRFLRTRWTNIQPLFDMFTSELHRYAHYQHQIPRSAKLNANSVMLPFEEICQRGFYELSLLLCANRKSGVFIRPDQALKVCEGEVLTVDSFEQWASYQKAHSGLQPNSLMWVAPQKIIHQEYRCLVLNGEVMSISSYGFEQTPKNHDDASRIRDFAEGVAKHVSLQDPAYCLDVAETPEGLKVVELNCLATSGHYALNTSALAVTWRESLNQVYQEYFGD